MADLPGTRQVRSLLTIISAEPRRSAPGPAQQSPPKLPGESAGEVPDPPRGALLFGSSEITTSVAGNRYIEAVADYLKRHPELIVHISGHTDAVGPRALNQELSENRAEAVAALLAARGVDRTRLVTRGFADSRPVDASI